MPTPASPLTYSDQPTTPFLSGDKSVGKWFEWDNVTQRCYSYQVPSEFLTVADGQMEGSKSILSNPLT